MTAYRFTRAGRRPATLLGLVSVWAALIAAYAFLDAAVWIVGLAALVTVPALYDFVANPMARLSLDDTELAWESSRQSRVIPLVRIDKVRFDTRLDFTVRVTVILDGGEKLRVPPDCLPPHKRLKIELDARDVATERHHFALL